MSKKREQLKAQVKSKFYYYFWGIATVSVVLGQLYVGTGYRLMANANLQLQDLIIGELR
jgi:hypothetical protein